MKAIETTYNGIVYRSRAEARGARGFDLMGVSFEHEPKPPAPPQGG